MLALAEILPSQKPLTGSAVLLWAQILAPFNVTDDEFEAACAKHAQISKFFPAPSEIIEIVRTERKRHYYAACEQFALPEHEMSDDERRVARSELIALRDEMREMRPHLWEPEPLKESSRVIQIAYQEPTEEELAETARLREKQIQSLRSGA